MATSSSNPQTPAPMRHEVALQMRFNDIDVLGHLNNSVYIQFFDLGKSRYFTDVWPVDIDRRNVNIVVANINCDFCAPTFASEPIAVQTAVRHIGEKSFTMEQRIVNTATGQVKCVAHTVMVGFDPATNTSAPIPPVWIDALEAYEGRKLR